jgi:hypothetical protein
MYMAGLGKSQGETAFDSGRANLWSEFVALHAQLDPLMSTGQITGAQAAAGVSTVLGIINRHKGLYATAKAAGVPVSWLDPRFSDYEKPFEDYLAKLQSIAAAAGVAAPTTGAPVVQLPTDMSTPTQLIIQGGTTPSGIPSASTTSAPGSSGSGLFADLFGPPAPTTSPQAGVMDQIGPYVPYIAAGLALAYFLKKK